MKTLQMTLSNKKNNFIPYIMAGDHEKGLEVLKKPFNCLNKPGAPLLKLAFHFQIRLLMVQSSNKQVCVL